MRFHDSHNRVRLIAPRSLRRAGAIGLAFLAACLGVGCATAVPRQFASVQTLAPYNQAAGGAAEASDEAIETLLRLTPQFAPPVRIAIYERARPVYVYEVNEENEHLPAMLDALGATPSVAQAIPLSSSFVEGKATPRSIRQAAAAHGADLALFLETDFRVDVEDTALGLFDLTYVGAYWVPSDRLTVEARASLHLIHTRTGRVLFGQTATLERTGLVPSAKGRARALEWRGALLGEAVNDLLGRFGEAFGPLAAEETGAEIGKASDGENESF
jgi:hypothetical protein